MPFRSWGPGDTFRASVMTLSDRTFTDSARITARLLDRQMKPMVVKHWKVKVEGGQKSVPAGSNELAWAIPSDTPDSYFFLELTLTGRSGKCLSRQVYWQRALRALADPEARRKWQAGPVPEHVCTNGP
jgi:hypothetical protein